jgi:glutamate formiminotransferase/formiminotetrahydrofolate cyclodeaminase
MAIGARKFLIAYNINLNSTNLKMAKDISFNIREKGLSKRVSYPEGEIVRGENGKPVEIPGLFQACKAGAWIIPEYGRAQITMNLTDMDITAPHQVFDEVEKQAQERGMRVTGSEIVGLVPLQAIMAAGRHYLKRQGLSCAVSEAELVRIAVLSLGLNDVSKFIPEEKIIEYRFKRKEALVNMSVEKFADTLASDAPAPGGGSTAALCGALSAALAAMVSNLTYGKNEYHEVWEEMEEIGLRAQKGKEWYLSAIDRDTDAFNALMNSIRMPNSSAEEKEIRNTALEQATKNATIVPLEVLEKTLEISPLLKLVAERGNPNSVSDAGVGAHCLRSCAESAALNVKINLPGIKDENFKKDCLERMEGALKKIRRLCQEVINIVEGKVKS